MDALKYFQMKCEREMMVDMILFPSSFFDKTKVDEDLQKEYDAVLATGLFPYYTIDFAELEDGTWKIVEAGDGGGSGLSDNQDYEQYFRALHQCFAYHF